ncbi:MAG: efflux RND transporter periplasmic adaptor subunit [Pseudomonadota bacterium]
MNFAKLSRIAVVLLLGGAAAWWYTRPDPAPVQEEKKPAPPVPVKIARASTADVPVTLDLVGRGEAWEQVTLKARVDGQVKSVEFREGQRVAAGDLLLRLDEADFRARAAQAEATLARDQALLAKARADVARYQALKDQGFVSEEKVAEVRATAEAMAATVQADQAALDLARIQLGHTQVRAPFAGLVGTRLVHPGTAVKVNDTELATVSRIRPLYVNFAVPEGQLPALRAALAARRLAVEVAPPGSGPGQRAEPRFVDHAVASATGTLAMKAELANPDEALVPGQFLDVRLVLDTLKDAVTVPAEAVQQGPKGSFVYVVTADGDAAVRPVSLSTVRSGRAAIARGLAVGETVVVDGHSRLFPGAKVKVKEPGDGQGGKP